MKIRAAPRALLPVACGFSPPYFRTVLTLPFEPGDWRVLENPRFVICQARQSRADATYDDDKDRLREHSSLQLTTAPARRNQAPQLGQRSVPDSEPAALRNLAVIKAPARRNLSQSNRADCVLHHDALSRPSFRRAEAWHRSFQACAVCPFQKGHASTRATSTSEFRNLEAMAMFSGGGQSGQ
jgi:hypothetical protein